MPSAAPDIDEILSRTGDVPGKYTPKVEITHDFKRVHHLPRRVWQQDPDLEELCDLLTARYRAPGGTMRFKPAQAQFLREVHRQRGAMVPVLPGGGKTLMSFMQGAVLGTTNNMVIVPAAGGMRDKTKTELREYAQHWQIPPTTIISYEQISQEQLEPGEPSIVQRYMPRSIFCDEAGALANTGTACWKAISRYVRAMRKTGHEVVITFADGTFADDSMRQYWHLARLALQDGAPVPHEYHEMQAWCGAMDVQPMERCGVGALMHLGPLLEDEADLPERRQARRIYQRRLCQTPGVVATDASAIPKMPLTLSARHSVLPDALKAMQAEMRVTKLTPGGDRIWFATDMWRHQQTMALGLYEIWDPPAPRPWMDARLEWNQSVAGVLSHSTKLDKPSQVTRAVKAGMFPRLEPILDRWREIEPTFIPNPVPVWVDDTPLKWAAEWLQAHPELALVWIAHTSAGHRLSEISGVPYYGAKGTNASGIRVDKAKGSAIVSLPAVWKGYNLQARCQNLYLSIPTKAKRWEQSLARTHREGQLQAVTAELWIACPEHEQAIASAFARARYVHDTFDQPQKLLYAKNLLPVSLMSQVQDLTLEDEQQEEEEEEDPW